MGYIVGEDSTVSVDDNQPSRSGNGIICTRAIACWEISRDVGGDVAVEVPACPE